MLIHREDTIETAVFFCVDAQRTHNWNSCVPSCWYTENTNWNSCVPSYWYTEKTQLEQLCSFVLTHREDTTGTAMFVLIHREDTTGTAVFVRVDTQRTHNWNRHMARNNPNIKTAITVAAEAGFWFLRKIVFQTLNIYSYRLSATVTEQYCFFDHRQCWKKEKQIYRMGQK
jgi:hypothetical protein